MKLIHISDLHFGKSLKGLNLIDTGDQPHWVDSFLKLLDKVKPDALLISGDVYDRGNPSNDAIELLDYFLSELAKRNITVFMIAGNHDAIAKINYSSTFLAKSNIYAIGDTTKEIFHVTLQDEYGDIVFWLMPYTTITVLKELFDTDFSSETEAFSYYLKYQDIDISKRNVLLAHQYVTSNDTKDIRGGSETFVGGSASIDASVFESFDYVALGHIHATYPIHRDTIRYCGSIMNYHFDETRQMQKGPIEVDVQDKNTSIHITHHIINQLHPLRIVEGTFQEIIEQETNTIHTNEYLSFHITDQRVSELILATLDKLASDQHSICLEVISNYDTNYQTVESPNANMQEMHVKDLFAIFYEQRKNEKISAVEQQILSITQDVVLSDIDEDKKLEKFISYLEKETI